MHPQSLNRILFKMTALSAVAHGDAGTNRGEVSNLALFNREAIRLPIATHGANVDEVQVGLSQVLDHFPIPDGRAKQFLSAVNGAELLAILYAVQVPLAYTGDGDGEGLFGGVERYKYLLTRLSDGVVGNTLLSSLWSFLCAKLRLSYRFLDSMVAFTMLPKSVQGQITGAIAKNPQLIVFGAQEVYRAIADGRKGKATATPYSATDAQIQSLTQSGREAAIYNIPALSVNSLRNDIRHAGATRLFKSLGVLPSTSDHSENALVATLGIERLFYGGGQVQAKAKAPSSSDLLEANVRQWYPILDGLGGCVDNWLFSESRAKMSAWLVCAENNRATKAIAGIESGVSIFEQIQEITKTRVGIGGKGADDGQMIFTYEALCAGVEAIAEIRFLPFTRDIVKGAVYQALLDWDGTFGGKSQIGHGRFAIEIIEGDALQLCADQYLDYLSECDVKLVQGLCDGTLGTGAVLCAA